MGETLTHTEKEARVQFVLSTILAQIEAGETVSTRDIKDALEKQGLSRRSVMSVTAHLDARVRDSRSIVKERAGLSRIYRKVNS